jgi:hypothetical protein
MALIEELHVLADMFPTDPATNPMIIQGWHVMLNANGFLVGATGGANTYAIGIAADRTDNTGIDGRAYAADLVINPAGATRRTQNRVSDFYDEGLASGKVTVYHGGGRFSTDQYLTTVNYVLGAATSRLYVNATHVITSAAAANVQVVGQLLVAPREYPSGVPGTDTADGSISLGVFLTFQQVNYATA